MAPRNRNQEHNIKSGAIAFASGITVDGAVRHQAHLLSSNRAPSEFHPQHTADYYGGPY